jgi:hypothetical protein
MKGGGATKDRISGRFVGNGDPYNEVEAMILNTLQDKIGENIEVGNVSLFWGKKFDKILKDKKEVDEGFLHELRNNLILLQEMRKDKSLTYYVKLPSTPDQEAIYTDHLRVIFEIRKGILNLNKMLHEKNDTEIELKDEVWAPVPSHMKRLQPELPYYTKLEIEILKKMISKDKKEDNIYYNKIKNIKNTTDFWTTAQDKNGLYTSKFYLYVLFYFTTKELEDLVRKLHTLYTLRYHEILKADDKSFVIYDFYCEAKIYLKNRNFKRKKIRQFLEKYGIKEDVYKTPQSSSSPFTRRVSPSSKSPKGSPEYVLLAHPDYIVNQAKLLRIFQEQRENDRGTGEKPDFVTNSDVFWEDEELTAHYIDRYFSENSKLRKMLIENLKSVIALRKKAMLTKYRDQTNETVTANMESILQDLKSLSSSTYSGGSLRLNKTRRRR